MARVKKQVLGPERSYQDYLKSDRWKCGKSPTGAHHWVERGTSGIFICKYCMDVAKFPRTFADAIKMMYGDKTPNLALDVERLPAQRQSFRIPKWR